MLADLRIFQLVIVQRERFEVHGGRFIAFQLFQMALRAALERRCTDAQQEVSQKRCDDKYADLSDIFSFVQRIDDRCGHPQRIIGGQKLKQGLRGFHGKVHGVGGSKPFQGPQRDVFFTHGSFPPDNTGSAH